MPLAQAAPEVRRPASASLTGRIATDGKFLRAGDERFLVKGVTYGTFAPDSDGYQFPPLTRVAEDFRLMAELGINTVRTYTPPRLDLLDEAAKHGLRVMAGLPWSQHVAFLDDRALKRRIRREIVAKVSELGRHPAMLACAVGNEIPPNVVRWHGRVRVEHFLHDLYEDAKNAAPECLLTYVNFPPTEFLDLSFFDICAFNIYLHREQELRAYLTRLQHIAGQKPLLLAEAGADSLREGEAGQAAITAMHIRAAFEEGACGACAFAWTDEWWRGGHPVDDWKFGLVDAERRPKMAAQSVADAFADAPFPAERRAAWPRVSVLVCAYNAADTLEDNLRSLEKLTYPDFEIVLVNDGSKDRTSEIAKAHPRVRVIETPNQGLSAARNVALAEATGEIVAYTDADTRVDPDWLTFLVQPFLASDVVGSGGPNVVPADDPPVAQCIARAPGGPTHVLLDDRIAEHVPGCNMAFRRDALLAIGGFNPIYLRAGDDVDVCWRLQARGWKIGFASSALVWHHHRASVKAYWRQQVGYGEGETWLMAHHPEKFLDGHMLWRGRIYSPLPFVRSLWGTKINAGVWGTAAFPSVYRTDLHPFAFLPHSIRWQAISLILTMVGAIVAAIGGHTWAAGLLLGSGVVGLAVTIGKDFAYAMRSEVDSLKGSKPWYRLMVAYLHFLQPLARIRGRIRGLLSPPAVAVPMGAKQTSRGPRPSLAEAWRALLLISGSVTEDRFWSETWTSADRVLEQFTEWLRHSRAVRSIEIDEGWSDDRDVSVFVGRWAWLDVRALVEEHAGGKVLLRISTHLRPTTFGVVSALSIGAGLMGGALFGLALQRGAILTLPRATATTSRFVSSWPVIGPTVAIATVVLVIFVLYRTAQATAIARRGVGQVTANAGMIAMASGPARAPLVAPSIVRRYGLRSALVFVLMVLSLGASTLLLREAATGPVIGGRKGYAGDYGPAIEAWLDSPNGIVVGSNGDIYFADSNNHLIRRIDARNNPEIEPVAGSHELGGGFSGDNGPAIVAQLDTPDGVSIAPDGDIVVADSHNDRIRRVDRQTKTIITVAGSGENGYDGDDKPAIEAALNTPSAVACAPNGDIYIADTLNYRVRMIEAKTGLIHTIAGDGQPGDPRDGMNVGDGGPAISSHLNMPSDVAIERNSGDIYIADMHHNRIRRVDAKTRLISTVAGNGKWGYSGDDGPATDATLAGPAGMAVVSDGKGRVTIFIADYYNGHVRAVGPDGIIRDLNDEGRTVFGAPTRVTFASSGPRAGWLYVSDSSKDRIVPLYIPTLAPSLVTTAAAGRTRTESGRMNDPVVAASRQKPLLPWTLSFLRPYRSRVVLLTFLLVSEIGLGALQPWPLSIVIDYVLGDRPWPSWIAPFVLSIANGHKFALLVVVVIAGVVLQVVNQFVSAYGTQVQVDAGQRMVYDLRARLFQHLTNLGLHHHIHTSTADAVYRVDVDAYAIENLVMSGIFPLATSITALTVMFATLAYLNLTIALLSLTVVPFLYLCLRYYTSTLSNREERVKELESKLLERLYETFGAIRLVKSFSREQHELNRYTESGEKTMQARIAITWQSSLFSVVVSTVTILGTALVVIVGGSFVMNGRLTVGQLLVVISYLGAVYGPLSSIAHTTGQLQGALAGARRVRAMFAMIPETEDEPGAIDADAIQGDVRFDRVSFTYPSGKDVLHDIEFEVKPGQMIALVGLTGAGKTTLVSLIPRFYNTSLGRVVIDGVDVRNYRVQSLRERIAIVLQDPVLFSGTIADNIRYGRLDATDAEIEAAAKAAHAHDFIARLPKGYETAIAEAGGSLSGGERQRLSIARAILKNAPILILDEPTSSLDAISEEIVFNALRHLREGRTTIVIAHRLSTVRDADRILVLDGGRIAAQGKHDDLLEASELYRRMCARLSVGKSLDDPETVDELIEAAKR